MTSLFIFFVHGGKSNLKMAMCSVIKKTSNITMGINYENGKIDIIGCDVVTGLMSRKAEWFREPEPGQDKMALYKQAVEQIKETYTILPEHICFYSEGNFTNLGGEFLEQVVVDMLNYTRPGFAMLPTGTPACCQFINYWIDYHGLPRFELKAEHDCDANYFDMRNLTEKKVLELQHVARERCLSCTAPVIATFEKTFSAAVIADVFDMMSIWVGTIVVAKDARLEFLSERTSKLTEVSDDTVYFFEDNSVSFRQTAFFSPVVDDKDIEYSNIITTGPMTPYDDSLSTDDFSATTDGKANSRKCWGLELPCIDEQAVNGRASSSSVSTTPPQVLEPKTLVIDRQSSSAYIVEQEPTQPTSQKKSSPWWSFFVWCCGKENAAAVHTIEQKDRPHEDSISNTLA